MSKIRFPLVISMALCGCQSGGGSGGGGGGGGGGDQFQETNYDGLPDDPTADLGDFIIQSRWQRRT